METSDNTVLQKELPAKEDDIVIYIRGLKKSFGKKNVLRNINLEVKRGENVVMLGRSGSGKSIMLQCIVGMLEPDKGILEVLGNKIAELNDVDLKELRTKIGFLFQGGALYDSMTVGENMEFPLTRILRVKDRKEINRRVK